MIKDFEPRLYQQTIFATSTRKNTLVVLPTGLGKTNISLMLAAHRLNLYPNKKILILAPTKPLCEQHIKTFEKHLPGKNIVLFTGLIKPEKRQELWKDASIIVSTPQGLENDIISKRINLSEVSLLVFDEAHRATGDYSYVWVAKQYDKIADFSRILALTASPGSDLESIKEVCNNLHIEEIEVRTDSDPDVKPYMHNVSIDWEYVDLPLYFKEIQKLLQDCYKSKLSEIKNLGFLNSIVGLNKIEILKLQGKLQAMIASGEKSFEILKSMSLAAEAMKVQHAIELIETQGLDALKQYFEKLENQSKTTKVKAVQNLVRDFNYRNALVKTNALVDKGVEHPKLSKLREIIINNKDKKIIVFNQYRDSASKIVDELNRIEGIEAKLFVGQTIKKNTGLTQKKQIEMLNDFRQDNFNVLVSSSVGEEGLDIPSVDIVIFFEPVPSAIRSIQRRGRTGRHGKGKVIMLSTKGTRDDGYKWSAHHKEKRMYRVLKDLKKNISLEKKEVKLNSFIQKEDIKIFADYREKGSGVIKELIELGANIKLEKLDVGDYLLSSDVGVEFKVVEDFVNSIIDGRLLIQLKELKKNFEKPLIIVEGNQDIYSIRNIHPNAIRGMLATIAVSYSIPVIFTKNFKETASILAMIAKREQVEGKKDFTLHGSKKPMSIKEQQEYIVSSLPGVGAGLAKPLLEKFKSVKNVVNAGIDELKGVEKIGDLKAKKIKEIVDREYQTL